MKITRMRTNRMENPMGFQMDTARLAYTVEDTSAKAQKAARIIVATDAQLTQIVWDSTQSAAIDNLCCTVEAQLMPCTRYYWNVSVWADNGDFAVSDTAWFETPKAKDALWKGRFITPCMDNDMHPMLWKVLQIDKSVVKARAYALGLGVYELYCNGAKVGDEVLLPGIHAYDSWLQYQTFDLPLQQGENLLSCILGDGWYKGAYGLKSKLPRHGDEFAFIADIEVFYSDGTREAFGTDLTWQARQSCIRFDSIYDGEIYDATTDTSTVYSVKASKLDTKRLQARLSPPIVINERIKPDLIHTPLGEWVLDMGQNIVGWVELQVREPKGTELVLQHGEILQNGNFYNENMRTAKCEYRYIANGNADTARAHFTFFGFRYVKLSGFTQPIDPACFTGCVIHSQMEETGTISTDNPLVNKLVQNIRFGQKGNFLDIPTDCPQRDERMGWTGDAQIFADTASFNMDTYAFYTKFCKDLAYEQAKCGGSVPYVVPMSRYELHGATVWGDAATVIPWQVYLHFGDDAILRAQYDSMKGWVDYIYRADCASGSHRLWTQGRHFGDWLALDGKVDGGVYGSTSKAFIATAYYYHSAILVAKAAKVLGHTKDEAFYQGLAREIKAAFQKEFFTQSGRLAVDTQTAYALVIMLELVPPNAQQRIGADFKAKLKENNFMLNTGFVGTPCLCPALSKLGLNDIAYSLVLNENYPGWLYEVKQGATTIWERWNSVLPDGSISGTGMNSLNHYAYGSIEAWMYRYMLGISPTEKAPGFREAVIAPMPSYRIRQAKGTLKTPAGSYCVAWAFEGKRLKVSVTVPFGARAQLRLPNAAGQQIQCNQADIVLHEEGKSCVAQIQAGSYEWIYTPNAYYGKVYNMDSNLTELMANEPTAQIIMRHFPRAERGIPFQNEGTVVGEIAESPFAEVSDEDMRLMREELEAYMPEVRQ